MNLHKFVGQFVVQFSQSQKFGNFLEQNFDKNTRRSGCVGFGQSDVAHGSPVGGGGKRLGEEKTKQK